MLTKDDLLKLVQPHAFVSDLETYILESSDLESYARAVIATNNAKVLAELKPVAFKLTLIGGAGGGTGFTRSVEIAGRTVETLNTPPLYSADTVSALIQRNEALEARVKELNGLLAKSLVNNMKLKATP